MKAGTYCAYCALILFLACLGCTHQKVVFDAKHPELAITNLGLTYRGQFVEVEDVPDLLESNDVPRDSTVNILIADEVKDYRLAYKLMGILAQNGYRRPILVSKEKSYSGIVDKKKKPLNKAKIEKPKVPIQRKKRIIRYK